MCKAFSAVVVRSGKVYWKFGMDSHEDIKDEFKLDDRKFGLCPVEISPKNNNYLKPDEWVFKFDDGIPDWWKASHEKHCWEAFKKWKKKLNKMLIPKEIVSPFEMSPPKKITTKHIRLLKEWASVCDSVWNSVWGSVGDSVGASVWDSVGVSVWASVGASVGVSVGDSVWDSVGGSVGVSVRASAWNSVRGSVGASVKASVRAYVGSFFRLPRKSWKYTSKIKTKGYPFQPVVTLWEMGLIPSFDGTVWRLHGGKKAKVLFEISRKELKKEKVWQDEIQ